MIDSVKPLTQRERIDAMVDRVAAHLSLSTVAVPEELAAPKAKLRLVDAKHWNWEGKGLRKLFAMHTSMRVPPIEQINFILYPAAGIDAPIFLFFCMITGRKLIGHINVNSLAWDEESQRKWVMPLQEAVSKYPPFESKDRYPEWMKKWRTAGGVYGMFMKDRVEDFSACMFDYLERYLDELAICETISNQDRLDALAASHDQFVDDIRTQDKAQGIMAKMIGKDTARRIFYEVTT